MYVIFGPLCAQCNETSAHRRFRSRKSNDGTTEIDNVSLILIVVVCPNSMDILQSTENDVFSSDEPFDETDMDGPLSLAVVVLL